jgi:hypothetical protein
MMYVTGLATMSVTQTASSVVMRLFRRPQRSSPWENSNWRRIAANYLGSGLSPDTAAFSSPEDLDRVNRFIAGMSSKEVEQLGIAKRRETLQTLEKSLAQIAGTITDATAHPPKPEIAVLLDDAKKKTAEAASTFKAQTEMLENVERQLRALGVEFEWISLYHALQFIQFSNLVHPYAGFELLMAALQSAGIAALWLMIQFGLWSLTGLLFASALVLATSYAQWLVHRLNEFLTNLDSAQLAGMIQEIRQRTNDNSAQR